MGTRSNINYHRRCHFELLKLKYSQKKVFSFEEESELNNYSSILNAQLDQKTI